MVNTENLNFYLFIVGIFVLMGSIALMIITCIDTTQQIDKKTNDMLFNISIVLIIISILMMVIPVISVLHFSSKRNFINSHLSD